jgi:hypothetical protein
MLAKIISDLFRSPKNEFSAPGLSSGRRLEINFGRIVIFALLHFNRFDRRGRIGGSLRQINGLVDDPVFGPKLREMLATQNLDQVLHDKFATLRSSLTDMWRGFDFAALISDLFGGDA